MLFFFVFCLVLCVLIKVSYLFTGAYTYVIKGAEIDDFKESTHKLTMVIELLSYLFAVLTAVTYAIA